ncbi:MAG: flagellin [Sporomusaceae bacterium]|nr:flagellin [Sporomusaceae bacterium]
MIINHNVTLMRAEGQNKKAAKAENKAASRLQSGLKINRAADDNAGLGISESMRAQIRGLSQAASNVQTGISMLQTADSHLSAINDPTLQRMRELAVQASNDSLTDSDRQRIQEEIQQLKSHLDNVFSNAEFNTQKIFTQIPKQITETKVYPSPGILAGDTHLLPDGLDVTPGQNQTMSFKLDGVPYSVSLDSGPHTPQQLLDDLNQKFVAAGTDVTAFYQGDGLAFNSPTHIMDSFGGDMIQINNPYTSILYDMAKHGSISGAAATGYGNLSSGLTITASNNTLTMNVDGAATSITLLSNTYTASGLLTEINNQLSNANIPVTATYTGGGQLQLMHNISGAGHTLDTLGGSAYPDLFQSYTALTESVYSSTYTTAAITGNKSLAGGVTITAGDNDSLKFTVDGTNYAFTVTPGTNLTATNIASDLNAQFAVQGLTSLTASSNSGQLRIAYNSAGYHSITGLSGTAVDDLFYSKGTPGVYPGSYQYIEGSSAPLPNGFARVEGLTDLSNGAIVRAGKNDTFSFKLDGTAHTITLDAGTYSASSFVTEINSKLSGLSVQASIGYSSYGSVLNFTNTHEGGGIPQFPYSLDSFSGNGYDAFMRSIVPTPVQGYDSKAEIDGVADLSTGITINSSNNTFSFKIGALTKTITLNANTYSASGLLTEINQQLTAASVPVTASYYGSTLRLTANNSGEDFSGLTGNAVPTLFRKNDYVGGAYYTLPSSTDAYVEGRLNLAAGVTIDHGVNDTLSFSVNGTDHSVTLPEGGYTPDKLLATLNNDLASFNVTASYNSKQQLRLTYSPGTNGSYVIDGVGGNASYTLFYPGPTTKAESTRDLGPTDDRSTLTLHVGANQDMNMSSGIPIFMATRTLGIDKLDLTNRESADKAITAVDQAMKQVSQSQTFIGATMQALQATLGNVTTYGEHLTDSESRLRDADMAAELMERTKNSIVAQASNAMMAQASKRLSKYCNCYKDKLI